MGREAENRPSRGYQRMVRCFEVEKEKVAQIVLPTLGLFEDGLQVNCHVHSIQPKSRTEHQK